jgi:hypothetical protein
MTQVSIPDAAAINPTAEWKNHLPDLVVLREGILMALTVQNDPAPLRLTRLFDLFDRLFFESQKNQNFESNATYDAREWPPIVLAGSKPKDWIGSVKEYGGLGYAQ